MSKSTLFLFIAAGAFVCPSSSCRASEQRSSVPAAPQTANNSIDPATLKSLLGDSAEVTETDHFAIVHEGAAKYVPGTSRTLERAYQRFYEAFSKAGFEVAPSQSRLVWICFPQQSGFNKYAMQAEGTDLSWLDSYYSTLTNRVAIVEPSPRLLERGETEAALTLSTPVALAAREGVLPISTSGPPLDTARLTHELAHQLAFNSGLQKRGVMYPFWISEGLATNFEFESLAGAGFEQCSTARRACLIKMRDAGELVPLRQFIVQTKVPADAVQSRRYYAQAWAFFQLMLTQHSENLRSYLHHIAVLLPDQRTTMVLLREFTDAFGSPEEIEDSWNAFLDRQAQQALAPADSASPAARK
jgi:hypothetical protein